MKKPWNATRGINLSLSGSSTTSIHSSHRAHTAHTGVTSAALDKWHRKGFGIVLRAAAMTYVKNADHYVFICDAPITIHWCFLKELAKR